MSLVLVARPSAEPSGHPIVPRFLRLLADGWDTHLVLVGGGAARLERTLPPEARERVRNVPPGARSGRPFPRGMPFRATSRRRGEERALLSLVAEIGADLVHLPSPAIADSWIEQGNGLPGTIVVSLGDGHGLEAPESRRRLWERIEALHVESEGLAQLARRLGASPAMIRVVPPVADLELAADLESPRLDPDELRLLSIGPLSWRQGYEHALVAVGLLRERGTRCRYRIVGDGPHADGVAFARHQLGLEDTVEIVPRGRDEVRAHLAWADALLNAAVCASSPKHLVDAQASGVPVVTTEAPPAGPDTALVVPPRDPEALADALGLVASDPALRGELADRGRAAADSERALADQLERFCELYRGALAGAT